MFIQPGTANLFVVVSEAAGRDAHAEGVAPTPAGSARQAAPSVGGRVSIDRETALRRVGELDPHRQPYSCWCEWVTDTVTSPAREVRSRSWRAPEDAGGGLCGCRARRRHLRGRLHG